jgi:hypothetical protein
MVWKYFDFENHWKQFYDVWITDEIQEILRPDMEKWCENNSINQIIGVQTWKKGNDLWCYSSGIFIHKEITTTKKKAYEFIDQHNIKKRFADRMRQLGTPINDPRLLDHRFAQQIYPVIEEGYYPQPKSWRANILPRASGILAEAQAATG